jgi:hypothetical protein
LLFFNYHDESVLLTTHPLQQVRIIYRLVEFSAGEQSYIPSHEAFFYCFEAVPMVFAIGLWAVLHPGRYLRGPESEFPKKQKKVKKDKKEKKSRKEKKAEAAALAQKEAQSNLESWEMQNEIESRSVPYNFHTPQDLNTPQYN